MNRTTTVHKAFAHRSPHDARKRLKTQLRNRVTTQMAKAYVAWRAHRLLVVLVELQLTVGHVLLDAALAARKAAREAVFRGVPLRLVPHIVALPGVDYIIALEQLRRWSGGVRVFGVVVPLLLHE